MKKMPNKVTEPGTFKQLKAQSDLDLVRIVIGEAREGSQAMRPEAKGLKFTMV